MVGMGGSRRWLFVEVVISLRAEQRVHLEIADSTHFDVATTPRARRLSGSVIVCRRSEGEVEVNIHNPGCAKLGVSTRFSAVRQSFRTSRHARQQRLH